MADALVLGASVFNVGVRVPSSAPNFNINFLKKVLTREKRYGNMYKRQMKYEVSC